MGFYHHRAIGTFHLHEAAPRRVVPSPERHQWDRKPAWVESATCKKCGCQKHRLKTQPDYTERYQLPGTTQLLTERPPCPGPVAAPIATTPSGLSTTYDEPAPYNRADLNHPTEKRP